VLNNEFVVVARIGGTQVIRITRTAKPFSTLDELRQAWNAVLAVLEGVDRARYALIVDIRSVSGRNDAAFESAFAPYRAGAQRGFRKVAVIVSTSSGQLQVGRHAKEDGLPVRGFIDPAAALAWAESP
jgi:hypothetical protein